MKCFRARWNEKNDRHICFLERSVGVNAVIEWFIPAFSHLNQGNMREVLNKEDKLCEVHICGPSGSRLLRDEAKKNFPW